MSYVGSWKIDDLLTFVVNTQVFATGVATDADAVPAYRVYEDETTTPILTGTMALLDSANTAGFYSEQITLSAANGFEKGKSYSIYISATVSSVAGATHRTFQIQAAVDAISLAGQAITAAAGVTFPSSVASPTNITAGTITTVTNLTNAPTAGDLTATMKTSVTTAATAATPTAAAVTGAVGSVAGAVGSVGAGGIAAASFAAGAVNAAALAADAGVEIADAVLDRDMSVGTDSGTTTFRTMRQALRLLRNKWTIAATTLTVYKEDDTATSWTGVVSTDAGAVPIVGNDPAG